MTADSGRRMIGKSMHISIRCDILLHRLPRTLQMPQRSRRGSISMKLDRIRVPIDFTNLLFQRVRRRRLILADNRLWRQLLIQN